MPLPFGIEFKHLLASGLAEPAMRQLYLLLPVLALISLYIGLIWLRLQARFYFLALVIANSLLLFYQLMVLFSAVSNSALAAT